MSRVRSAPNLRRFRTAAVTLAAITVFMFVLSSLFNVAITAGDWSLAASSGCLEVGRDPYSRSQSALLLGSPATVGIYVGRPGWSADFGVAWRPFHASVLGASRLVFPLWQPMLALTLLAAYLHGLIVGARLADRNSCRGCGYDLRSLAKGVRTCPECGLDNTDPPLARSQSAPSPAA